MKYGVIVTAKLPEPIDVGQYQRFVDRLPAVLIDHGMTDVLVGGAAVDRCLQTSLRTDAPSKIEAASAAQWEVEQALALLGCNKIEDLDWEVVDDRGVQIHFAPSAAEHTALDAKAAVAYPSDPMARAVVAAASTVPSDSGFAIEIVRSLVYTEPDDLHGRVAVFDATRRRVEPLQNNYSFAAFVSDLGAARSLGWLRERGDEILPTVVGRATVEHATEAVLH
jgi:hypothetical protein